jgi:chromosome segregation ATPase
MEETLIWVAGLVVELLLVVAVVLVVLLRRSRRERKQLLDRLAEPAKQSAEISPTQVEPAASVSIEPVMSAVEAAAVEAESFGAALVDAPLDDETEMAQSTDASIASEFGQLRESIDKARLDESVERLQQRLVATSQSLQRLAAASLEQDNPDIASLQTNLYEMTTEVDALQQSNAQLQQDLRSKTDALEQTAVEKREFQARVLQHAKKLRSDIATLRDRFKDSQEDVQRLQSEKAALATEYEALNKEYERVYANSAK